MKRIRHLYMECHRLLVDQKQQMNINEPSFASSADENSPHSKCKRLWESNRTKALGTTVHPSPGSTLIAFSSRNRTKFVINLVPIITNSTLTRGVLTNKGVDSQVSLTSAGLEERVQRAVMNGPMCNGAA